MDLRFWTRASDSPWIDNVWTCTSDGVADMTSVAGETWGLVFWQQGGAGFAAVTGPESRTGTAPVPEGAAFVGIEFALGTSLRVVSTPTLVDGGITLPDTTTRGFRLDGRRWETPGADDAEALVARLIAHGVIERDPVVADVLAGRPLGLTDRSFERRFRAATGLTRGGVRQIVRARTAAVDLMNGDDVARVVDRHGFYDEPHLARALRRFVGRTASALRDGRGGAIALDPGPVRDSDQRTTSYTSLTTPLEYAAQSRR